MAEPRLRYGRVGSPEGVVLEDETGSEALEVRGGAAAGRILDQGGASHNARAVGAKGDGVQDDTVYLQTLIDRLSSAPVRNIHIPGGDYVISAALDITGQTDFTVTSDGATIRAADGMQVGSWTQLLRITSCRGFSVEDLNFDGNRDNRTPAEVTSHLVQIVDCQKWRLRNVRADNGTTDGFYIGAADKSDPDTFCRDFEMSQCFADNCYRQGMTIVNAYDGVVSGGAYTNTNGTAPQAGIDVESNADAFNPSNRSLRFIGVRFEGNGGYGLLLSSVENPHDILVMGCFFSDCALGGVHATSNTVFVSCEFDDFTAPGAVGVWSSTLVGASMRLIGCTFRDFGPDAGECVYDGSMTLGVSVLDCQFYNVRTAINSSGSRIFISGGRIEGTSATAVGIGSTSKEALIDGVDIIEATGRAVYSSGANTRVHRCRIRDVRSVTGAYVQLDGEGAEAIGNKLSAATLQATTHAIRATGNARAVMHNDAVNLHSTDPYTFTGGMGTALVGYNSGGSANNKARMRSTLAPPTYSDASRPAANTVLAGAMIWNTTDTAPNWSDGTNWRDAAGAET